MELGWGCGGGGGKRVRVALKNQRVTELQAGVETVVVDQNQGAVHEEMKQQSIRGHKPQLVRPGPLAHPSDCLDSSAAPTSARTAKRAAGSIPVNK